MAKFVSVEVTPTCFVGTLDRGEVLFDLTEVKGVVPTHGGSALLKSVTYIDLDDQVPSGGAAILFFKKGLNSIGSLGAPPNITDANLIANEYLGDVTVPAPAAGTKGDLIASYSQSVNNVDLVIDTADGSNSIYIASTSGATQTRTAEGLRIRLGFEVN